MKKILFITGCCMILFFSNAFTLNSLPDTTYKKLDVIGCGPVNNNNRFAATDSLEEIAVNDNREPAGEMRNGVLYIQLETRTGAWYPETHDGSGLRVYAFAEAGKPLQLPGPQIRVPEGTTINAEIHNTIPGLPLVLHGFYSRPGNPGDSVSIPYGETYKMQFKTGNAGTYFYWATSSVDTLKTETGLPFFNDSQLYGAFIVDSPNTKPDPLERVMMIGVWNDTLNGPFDGEELVINGLTWPYTERLTYQQNEPVNWRIINASNQPHPMHLHGFYFKVNSRGNADTDNIYKDSDRYLAVTELIQPHQTISMTWTPEREGNWLFHCHTLVHITAGSFLRKETEMTEEQMNDIATHARDGMGGLIMGITVLPSKNETAKAPDKKIKERELTLTIREKKNYYDTLTGYGFVLTEGNTSTDINASIPGPPIILERGKPVAIKIINHLHEATSMHWHGLEIESYFDGVAGWGNRGKELAPLIMPGDSFIVHIAPPRAGTFIYHTHMHNMQLIKGMCGPLIVTEPGKKYNSSTDKIFMLSQGGSDVEQRIFFLNGKRTTDTIQLQRGITYRFRIVKITAVGIIQSASISMNGVPVKWRIIANDGADLPAPQQVMKEDQPISIGQTVDLEFTPNKAGNYSFNVKNFIGKVVVSEILQVKS